MTDSIFLIQGESNLVEMKEAPYDSEHLLQTLIASYPNVLAGDQMNPDDPRRWLLVTPEMPVPGEEGGSGRWSLDHLFLDQDAIPTLVEVKRSTDTRIRREVVGQMLDYAANAVVYWPLEKIRSEFQATCVTDEADEHIANLIEVEPTNEEAIQSYWQQVKTNLQAGRIRMVFVADEIPSELRRIIEFLNGQTDPAEVLGVELKQYKDENGGLQTLVPRVIGQTAAAQAKKTPRNPSATRVPIEEQEFRTAAAQQSRGGSKSADGIIDWARQRGFHCAFNRGKKQTTCIPYVEVASGTAYPFSFKASGLLVFQMSHLCKIPPFDNEDLRIELQQRLSRAPGFQLRGGMRGRPLIDTREIEKQGDRDLLIETLDWIADKLVNVDAKNA